jgi:hypothetical protein
MPPFHICSDLDNHICFDKDNAAAARQIHDCALRFDVNNLPNSADCRITEYTAGTRVKLTITKVRCIDPCRNEGLEGIFESAPDFYALVDINGVVTQTAREENDAEIIFPPKFGHPWTIFADIPMAQSSFPVSIQIWDKDDSSPDDLGDASPIAGKNNLDLTVDRVTGKWTGDVTWPQTCAQGGNPGGNPAVEVCFIVEVEGS